MIVVLHKGVTDPGLIQDMFKVQELLGLETGLGEFEITYGLLPCNNREVALLSRSMLELMLEQGFGIDLPAAHLADGRAIRRTPHSRRFTQGSRCRRTLIYRGDVQGPLVLNRGHRYRTQVVVWP